MFLSQVENAMRIAQSRGYDSAASRAGIPDEYAADKGMKSAWDYGRALAECDGPNYWSRYQRNKSVSAMDPGVEHRWQTCNVADCETCQANVDDGYVIACDGCGEPGHSDADGWVMNKDNLVFCSKCAREQSIEAI